MSYFDEKYEKLSIRLLSRSGSPELVVLVVGQLVDVARSYK